MRRFLPGLFLLALLFSSQPSQGAEVVYTGEGGRDPFAAPFENKKIVENPDINLKKMESLSVQGIVASAANPRAIVNGKIYRVGNDVLPGIKISRIEKEGVFVMVGEKETLLAKPIQPIKGKTAQ